MIVVSANGEPVGRECGGRGRLRMGSKTKDEELLLYLLELEVVRIFSVNGDLF